MDSTYVNKEPAPGPFPKMMISENHKYIVLFQEEGEGCVVHSSTPVAFVGENISNWDMSGFKDFHGTVTITTR